MTKEENFKSFGDLMKKRVVKKPPAYQWQELALRIIQELNVPNDKRGSVFRASKQYSRAVVEKALNDTKELCQSGEQWRYFFKIIGKKSDAPKPVIKKDTANKISKDSDLPF